MRLTKFIIFYLSLIMMLNSCGFQLRKPIQIDYQSYSIIGESSGFSKIIHKQFSFANIKKAESSNAELVIEIMSNKSIKRILTLARNGQVGEYELIQTIEYRIKTNGLWSKPRKLEAIREYTYDPTLYNAARAEERFLKESMIDQLSRSLITEINNLGK